MGRTEEDNRRNLFLNTDSQWAMYWVYRQFEKRLNLFGADDW
jgi:hypothetical protein